MTTANSWIAGKRTATHWRQFRTILTNSADAAAWEKAFSDYFHARVSSRYLDPIRLLQQKRTLIGEGFSILAIQCTLVEFFESTIEGKNYRFRRKRDPQLGPYEYMDSGNLFTRFLVTAHPFHKTFDTVLARDFYQNVRCALLHEARTKNGWTVLAKPRGHGLIDAQNKIVYRDNFQAALEEFISWYGAALPRDRNLQEAFIRKFDSLAE